jgi:hypothetical protein
VEESLESPVAEGPVGVGGVIIASLSLIHTGASPGIGLFKEAHPRTVSGSSESSLATQLNTYGKEGRRGRSTHRLSMQKAMLMSICSNLRKSISEEEEG